MDRESDKVYQRVAKGFSPERIEPYDTILEEVIADYQSGRFEKLREIFPEEFFVNSNEKRALFESLANLEVDLLEGRYGFIGGTFQNYWRHDDSPESRFFFLPVGPKFSNMSEEIGKLIIEQITASPYHRCFRGGHLGDKNAQKYYYAYWNSYLESDWEIVASTLKDPQVYKQHLVTSRNFLDGMCKYLSSMVEEKKSE